MGASKSLDIYCLDQDNIFFKEKKNIIRPTHTHRKNIMNMHKFKHREKGPECQESWKRQGFQKVAWHAVSAYSCSS